MLQSQPFVGDPLHRKYMMNNIYRKYNIILPCAEENLSIL